MKNNLILREYFTIGHDVLRSCWVWNGRFKNEVPWLNGVSARRLVRDEFGHGVEPDAHVSGCLLGNKACVNPAHTYSSNNLLERLGKYIRPARSDGCMMWTGCTLAGYPLIMIEGKTRRASRVLWELVRGPIPAGLYVLHRCDVSGCMAIDAGHLWLGTAADNTADMIEKGRAFWQKAEHKRGKRNVDCNRV